MKVNSFVVNDMFSVVKSASRRREQTDRNKMRRYAARLYRGMAEAGARGAGADLCGEHQGRMAAAV